MRHRWQIQIHTLINTSRNLCLEQIDWEMMGVENVISRFRIEYKLATHAKTINTLSNEHGEG